MKHAEQSDDSAQKAKSEPITCPCCHQPLSETQIRSILGQFARSQRLSEAGVASRFAKMSPDERSAEQSRVSKLRWAKYRGTQNTAVDSTTTQRRDGL
jgi:hypothetical protein